MTGKKWARVEYGPGCTQLVTSDGILARSASYGSLRFHATMYCRQNGLDGYTDRTQTYPAIVQQAGVFVRIKDDVEVSNEM